jgi:hypothetical protein
MSLIVTRYANVAAVTPKQIEMEAWRTFRGGLAEWDHWVTLTLGLERSEKAVATLTTAWLRRLSQRAPRVGLTYEKRLNKWTASGMLKEFSATNECRCATRACAFAWTDVRWTRAGSSRRADCGAPMHDVTRLAGLTTP